MDREKLKRSHAHSCADQCREMGLVVGDVIVGREEHSGGKWSEAELTVIFIGQDVVVFSQRTRSFLAEEWINFGESGNWMLYFRDWYKINKGQT